MPLEQGVEAAFDRILKPPEPEQLERREPLLTRIRERRRQRVPVKPQQDLLNRIRARRRGRLLPPEPPMPPEEPPVDFPEPESELESLLGQFRQPEWDETLKQFGASGQWKTGVRPTAPLIPRTEPLKILETISGSMEKYARAIAATILSPFYKFKRTDRPVAATTTFLDILGETELGKEALEAYDKWEEPSVDIPFLPLFRFPWTSDEERERPWKLGVKGVAEEYAYLPLWAIGGKGSKNAFQVAAKIAEKQTAGKTLTAVERNILTKVSELEARINAKIAEKVPELGRLVSEEIGGVRLPRNVQAIGRGMIDRAKAGETIPESELKALPEEAQTAMRRVLAEIKAPKPTVEAVAPKVVPKVTPEVPAVEKLLTLLKATGKERRALEKLKTKARAPKFAELKRRLGAAKTFEEVTAAKKISLKGKIIPEGADITPLAREFTEVEETQLVKFVLESPVFGRKIATAANTSEALGKLLQAGKIPTVGERRNLIRVFGKRFEEALPEVGDTRGWQRFADILTEITNTPKTTMSMLDLSSGRQMAVALTRHPITAIRNLFATGAKAGLRQKWFDGIVESIAKNRFAPEADAFGLPLTTMGGHVLKREEAYVSGWLQNLAGNWGSFSIGRKLISAPLWPVGQVARMSERAFIATLNKTRMDIFSRYAALWEGKAGEAELRGMAELIGITTGRGTPPKRLKPFMALLNNVWFSPALQLSRVQFLALPFTLWKYPPLVRKYAISNIISFYATMASILAMLKFGLPELVSVETDSRSADFGKVRIGDTRLDPWGGHQQYAKLFARLISGEMITASGEIMEIDREEELLRFWRSKENPFVGLIHDIFKGETFLGEELTLESEDLQEQAFNRTAPFFIRDVLEALKTDGLLGGLTSSAGFVGVGVISYPSRGFADWLTAVQEKTGKEKTTDEMIAVRPDYNKAEASWLEYMELPSGRVKDLYRMDNPEIEASMYFWGEIGSLQNPDSEEFVQKLLKKHDLPRDFLPIREPVEPFDVEDKTETEVFGAFLNTLPTYLAEFADKNEGTFKDMASLITRTQELKAEDLLLIEKYYRETLGQTNQKRELYRRKNPEIDAALIFWGRVKAVKSSSARSLITQKAISLGFPPDVVLERVKTKRSTSFKTLRQKLLK